MKFLILFALLACAWAQNERVYPEFPRTCAERSAAIRPTVKTGFNVAAYSGTWFEIERYQQRDEPEADCLSSSYSWGFISNSFRIFRTGHDFSTEEDFNREAEALMAFPGAALADRLGLLNVTYYADREADETNYYVMGTDYFQYAVGWGCENIEDGENLSREFFWVLSRTPTLPESYRERVDQYITEHFDRAHIRTTEQDEEACLNRVLPNGERRTKAHYMH